MVIRLANHFYIKKFCVHCNEPIELEMLEEHVREKHIDILELAVDRQQKEIL